jgi:ABC-type transport system substrate-binding protein
MSALAGDPTNWNICPSFFTCGTPMASNVGSEALTGKRDFDKAKSLIAEAGYKGEKIVVLDAVDTPTAHAHGLVVFELLKKLGLNVELATSDRASYMAAERRCLVWLAERRETRSLADGMAEDGRQRGPPGNRRQDPSARLRDLALHPDGAMVAGDRLPQER